MRRDISILLAALSIFGIAQVTAQNIVPNDLALKHPAPGWKLVGHFFEPTDLLRDVPASTAPVKPATDAGTLDLNQSWLLLLGILKQDTDLEVVQPESKLPWYLAHPPVGVGDFDF